jgi:hypothetical protein
MQMYLLGEKKLTFGGILKVTDEKTGSGSVRYQKITDPEQSYKLHWSRRRDVLYPGPGGYKEMSSILADQ